MNTKYKDNKHLFIVFILFIGILMLSQSNVTATNVKEKKETDKNIFIKLETPDPQKHNSIKKFINYFERKGFKRFLVALKNFAIFYPMVEQMLIQKGFDKDFVLLAYVESEFNMKAISRKHAVGLWQFKSITAKHLGLMINYYIDERKDPYASTIAFIKHFKYLYKLYGSVEMALAAYNSGIGRVKKSIRRYNSLNYWYLINKRYGLPKETKKYVPKFFALIYLKRKYSKIVEKIVESNSNNFVVIELKETVSPYKLFNNSLKNYYKILKLNPHIKRKKLIKKSFLIVPYNYILDNLINTNLIRLVYLNIPENKLERIKALLDNMKKNDNYNDEDKNFNISSYLNFSFN